MSLRGRLALALTITVLIPMFGGALVVGFIVPRVSANASAERLETSVRVAATELSRQCTLLGLTARALAVEAAPVLSGEPSGREAAELDAQVEEVLTGLTAAGAAVVQVDGTVIASAGNPDLDALDGNSGTVTSWTGVSCADGEGVLSATGEPLQIESVPVRTEGGVIGYVLAVSAIDEDFLEGVRSRAGLAAGLALVTDAEVRVSGFSGTGVTEQQLRAVARDLTAALPDDAASTERPPAHGQTDALRFATVAGLSGLPGVVLVAVDPRGISHLAWAVPLLFALGGLLAIVGTIVLARRLTEPLAELTNTVSRLGAGELHVRSDVNGPDEIGRLATAVNTMADALHRSGDDLEQRREKLISSRQRLTELLARTHDMDGLLETVAGSVLDTTSADTCVIYLDDGTGLVQRAIAEVQPHNPATDSVLASAARQAAGISREVIVTDEPGFHVAALPLAHGDAILGAVVLAGRRRISERRLSAARHVVQAAGAAAHNVLAHDEAVRLCMLDPLTDLANFRALSQMLNREIERAVRFQHPLSVLMVDVDNFKRVNDTWGHGVGNQVLRAVADRLVELVREVDIVARYGGEEFLIVLPETGARGARDAAKRILKGVRGEPFTIVGEQDPLTITVSIGAASYPEHAEAAADLVRYADEALYDAKRTGRNRYVVAGEENQPARAGIPAQSAEPPDAD